MDWRIFKNILVEGKACFKDRLRAKKIYAEEYENLPGQPAISVVSETTFGQLPSVGTSIRYAREDHTHGTPPYPIPEEKDEIIPTPEVMVIGNQGVRVAQLNLEGGSYYLWRKSIMNRLIFSLTSVTGSVNLKFGIYQSPDGGSGIANKIASISSVVCNSAGNYEIAFDEGDVVINQGLFYLLWCKWSGTGSMRVYTILSYDLLNQNIAPNTIHPITFIYLGGGYLPVSINPKKDLSATTLNVMPVIRLRRV
ncbi:MAG: hypothetical protein QW052_06265 [Candidatus Nitrosocaldaceae archaeon]